MLYGDDVINDPDEVRVTDGRDYIEVQDYAANNTVYAGGNMDTVSVRNWATDNSVDGGDGNDQLFVQGLAHGNTLHGGAGMTPSGCLTGTAPTTARSKAMPTLSMAKLATEEATSSTAMLGTT